METSETTLPLKTAADSWRAVAGGGSPMQLQPNAIGVIAAQEKKKKSRIFIELCRQPVEAHHLSQL
jgi:hypothetical protein